ncbi:MAG: hypothetical protein ACR2IH_07700 [Pyrinomonadaceae bacterium]
MKMRKFIFVFVIMTLFAGVVIVATPETAQAQTYMQRVRGRDGRIHYVRVRKPSYYRRHRNRVNVAAGTAGGAIIGGLLGGGKGALIGAGVGAGSSALYTYKFNKKKRRYVKVRRRRL